MMEYSKGAQWYYRGMLQGGQFDLGGPQGGRGGAEHCRPKGRAEPGQPLLRDTEQAL